MPWKDMGSISLIFPNMIWDACCVHIVWDPEMDLYSNLNREQLEPVLEGQSKFNVQADYSCHLQIDSNG